MTEYRTGNHQPQNVYRGDAYIGVMFTAEDAAEVVRRMNGEATPTEPPILLSVEQAAELLGIGRTRAFALVTSGELGSIALGRSRRIPREDLAAYVARLRAARSVPPQSAETGSEVHRDRPEAHGGAEAFRAELVDALRGNEDTCFTRPDPDCSVHRGRRPKGPKPPPLGPGCVCDGSGRTCPRHGAVI